MINKEKLKEVIIYYKHYIHNQIGNILPRENLRFPRQQKKVVMLYGPRRSGKTFVLFNLFKQQAKRCLYVDFEDDRLVGFQAGDFETLREAFLELNPQLIEEGKKVFLLDEVQNINGWERFSRRLVEKENTSVFVAGSSSKFMPEEIHASLRGRQWSVEVTPFGFREYLATKDIVPDDEYIYGPRKVLTRKHFFDYLKWGGFPEVTFSKDEFEKRKLLSEYLGAMFFKDLIERFNITNIHLLDALIDRLFSGFSSEFSVTAFCKQYKDKFAFSKSKAFEYYHNILDSMLLFEVKKFAESTYTRMRNPAKIYLVDTGLAKRVTSEDTGRLLENTVFLQLRKNADGVFYFQEDKQCDFIVKRGNSFSVYQVCSQQDTTNIPRELEGLVAACKKLGLQAGTLLTGGQEEELSVENVKVKIVPVWKWLLTR